MFVKKYSYSDIKNIRNKTGAKLIDIRNALNESNGDISEALKLIRIKNIRNSIQKENHCVKEGMIASSINKNKIGSLVEVNCESDFVCKSKEFIELSNYLSQICVNFNISDVNKLSLIKDNDFLIKDKLNQKSAIFGERIHIKRIGLLKENNIISYMHKTNKDLPAQIGTLLSYSQISKNKQFTKYDELKYKYNINDLIMHITAFNPTYISVKEVPDQILEDEKEIAIKSMELKKNKIKIPKHYFVKNCLNNFLQNNVLLEQAFSKNTKLKINQLIDLLNIKINKFIRFKVG